MIVSRFHAPANKVSDPGLDMHGAGKLTTQMSKQHVTGSDILIIIQNTLKSHLLPFTCDPRPLQHNNEPPQI